MDEITFKLDVDANVRPSPSLAVNFRVEKGSVLRIRKFADVHSGMIIVRWFKVKTIYGEVGLVTRIQQHHQNQKL